tara:strand:- start:1251 stop:1565 length:315 start_codon:yes stop_codon:yes gene_type:complete
MINLTFSKNIYIYAGLIALVFGFWLLAYVLGLHFGSKQNQKKHSEKIAALTLELNQQNSDFIDAQIALSACKAKAAGDCALDCESLIQERVSQALNSCAELCKD